MDFPLLGITKPHIEMSKTLLEINKPHTKMAKTLLEMTEPRGLSISTS